MYRCKLCKDRPYVCVKCNMLFSKIKDIAIVTMCHMRLIICKNCYNQSGITDDLAIYIHFAKMFGRIFPICDLKTRYNPLRLIHKGLELPDSMFKLSATDNLDKPCFPDYRDISHVAYNIIDKGNVDTKIESKNISISSMSHIINDTRVIFIKVVNDKSKLCEYLLKLVICMQPKTKVLSCDKFPSYIEAILIANYA